MTVLVGPSPAIRLVRGRSQPAQPPTLDNDQLRAVALGQGSGPMVIVGAPGTGKSTTLIECIVARVERDGVRPDGVLLLAPTRTAAAALRDQLSARLARTVREPLARTPHSYAFGLLRRVRALDGLPAPRMISGPEQDRVLAELLAGHESGLVAAPSWPAGFGPEVRTLTGFRDELRDLLMRAVERGLGGEELAALGRRHDRPEWVSAGAVLEEYLDVTALSAHGAYDPAAIVDAAAGMLADDPELLAAERERLLLVAVDDTQEVSAATSRLIDQLAGDGRDLILTGDPDAATQGFRGARPQFLGGAAQHYRQRDGAPAATVVLRTVHRHGPELRAVAQRVAARIGSAGVVAHRVGSSADSANPANPLNPVNPAKPVTEELPPQVAVHVLASPAQEAAYVVQQLRRHHLEGSVSWGRMAIVVRSPQSADALRRALLAAAVPVSMPPAEVPVRDEPAVTPLRLALRCAVDPAALDVELAVELLGGPIGGVDAVAARRLRQALHAQEVAEGGERSSDQLLVAALTDPGDLLLLDAGLTRGARRVAAVLAAGRLAATAPAANAETVLWALWQATGLAGSWHRSALAGGRAGVRADRDLDAVVALFDAAARFVDRLPHAGPGAFLDYLEGQDLPSDTLAERAPDGESLALVTAQGAAAREWDVVAVTGVQEGTWPDLRLRNSVLGGQALADLLDGRAGAAGGTVAAQRRAVLDDELRLFHVAVSRARRVLLVTAVRTEDDAPSPFLDLVAPLPEEVEVRQLSDVPRALTLPGLVAELRAVVIDPQAPDARRRRAAAHLAALAREHVPGADPSDWYGLAPPSAPGPLRAAGQSVRVSPSKVEQFNRCGLRWLLESVGATAGTSRSQNIGTLVHELAEQVPDGDRAQLLDLLERNLDRLGLPQGWIGDRERERAQQLVSKFADYVRSSVKEGRELLAVEQDVEVQIGRAVVRGQVDRLERDADGRLFVVDLKTGKSAPSNGEVAQHAQLGVYQAAVEAGGFEAVAPGVTESGGAALVQLGTKTKKPGVQQQPALQRAEDPRWADDLIETVADGMAAEGFTAKGNSMCRMCGVRRSCPLPPEGRQVGE